jgi:DNA polymerase III delta prime subunit
MQFLTKDEIIQLQQLLTTKTLLKTADVDFRSALLINCGLGNFLSLLPLDKPTLQFVVVLCHKLSEVYIPVGTSDRLGLIVFLEYLSQIDQSLTLADKEFIKCVVNRWEQWEQEKLNISQEVNPIQQPNNWLIQTWNDLLGNPHSAPQTTAARPEVQRWLIDAVKTEVKSRLKDSLHNAVLINLGKEEQPIQVKRPWEAEIKIGEKLPSLLPEKTSILEVFDTEEIAGKLLILGAPGSGKTTTLLELARELITRAENEANQPIPVLFNLSTWKNNKQSISEWLVAELNSHYGVRADIGRDWLEKRQLLPLLDGLDEVESSRQELCIRVINQFLQGDTRPTFLVVCGRRQEYELRSVKLLLNGAICLQSFSEQQIKEYLQKIGLKELQQSIETDSEIWKLFKSPLLLSLTTLAYQEISITQWQTLNSARERQRYLFNAYIQRMQNRHITNQWYTKNSEPSPTKTLRWLTWLSKRLKEETKTDFLIEKINVGYLNGFWQKWEYRLFAIFLSGLIALLVFLPISSTAMSLIFWVSMALQIIFYKQINLVETLKFSWLNLKNSLKQSTIYGLAYGLTCGLISGYLIKDFNSGIVLGLIALFSSGLCHVLYDGLRGPEIDVKTVSNQGIKKSALNAVITGLLFSLFGGLIGRFSSIFLDLADYSSGFWSLFGILTGGCSGWLIGGGLACLQHFTLRLVLWLNGDIPWNYSRFLNYANERLFLQRVGGRYRFLHDSIREHFYSLDETDS